MPLQYKQTHMNSLQIAQCYRRVSRVKSCLFLLRSCAGKCTFRYEILHFMEIDEKLQVNTRRSF